MPITASVFEACFSGPGSRSKRVSDIYRILDMLTPTFGRPENLEKLSGSEKGLCRGCVGGCAGLCRHFRAKGSKRAFLDRAFSVQLSWLPLPPFDRSLSHVCGCACLCILDLWLCCVCACVRACVRMCAHVCMRACVLEETGGKHNNYMGNHTQT